MLSHNIMVSDSMFYFRLSLNCVIFDFETSINIHHKRPTAERKLVINMKCCIALTDGLMLSSYIDCHNRRHTCHLTAVSEKYM